MELKIGRYYCRGCAGHFVGSMLDLEDGGGGCGGGGGGVVIVGVGASR
jgi:hypothetical protein